MSTVILGSGMAGFGAMHRLQAEGLKPRLYDRASRCGGHTVSHRTDTGFTFDDGPHISFTKNERIQTLLADNIDHQYETVQAQVNNHWRGHWIKHPAQCNLHGLPTELVVDVLKDFFESRKREPGEIRNYADWLVASFGRTFAETFPMEYGFKYHTTTADNMDTDWLGPRLYRPELEEVLRGAVSAATPDVHYINNFRYPKHGGFQAYLRKFAERADLTLDHELVGLEPRRRELRFANGKKVEYEHVISSIPLTALIPMIDGTPRDVLEAAGRLSYSSCVVVNLGLNRRDISDTHWIYFYDRDYFFTRLSFPHMQSPNNAPPDAGSIQVETYYSEKYRPLDRTPEECIEPVIRDLRRCGLLRDEDRILHKQAHWIKYANVIFDLGRVKALEIVRGYLDDIGVASCGRYGEWGPHWTDESFESGEQAAQRVLNRQTSDAAMHV